MPAEARQVVKTFSSRISRRAGRFCRCPGMNLMEAYRVKQWNQVHETHESRKLKRLPWVAVPNKHDGLGFRVTVRQDDAGDLLAAWYLILQVASRGPKGVRGWLVRGDKALTACDLSIMTGLDQSLFDRALRFFVDPPADWLELAEFTGAPADAAAMPGDSTGAPADAAAKTPVHNSTLHDSTGSTKKREIGAGARMADVAASRTQAGALLGQIKALEGSELTPEVRAELRKKRALLARLQKKQAAGDFSPEQEVKP